MSVRRRDHSRQIASHSQGELMEIEPVQTYVPKVADRRENTPFKGYARRLQATRGFGVAQLGDRSG